MNVQYISDNLGNKIAVVVAIEDWTLIKNNYPDIENLEDELPQGQKDLIDDRLEAIAKKPDRLKPIEGLFKELKRKI